MDIFQLTYDLDQEIRRQGYADELHYHITQEQLELEGDDGEAADWTLTILERFGNTTSETNWTTTPSLTHTTQPVVRHDRLGGLIHVYRRAG